MWNSNLFDLFCSSCLGMRKKTIQWRQEAPMSSSYEQLLWAAIKFMKNLSSLMLLKGHTFDVQIKWMLHSVHLRCYLIWNKRRKTRVELNIFQNDYDELERTLLKIETKNCCAFWIETHRLSNECDKTLCELKLS